MSDSPSKVRTFQALGVELTEQENDNAIGDCPFCGKESHFFVNPSTGQWDCKHCGEKGNLYSFLDRIVEHARSEFDPARLAEISKLRKLPQEAFRAWGVLKYNGEWWLPVRSDTGHIRDIRRWDGRRIKATAGCFLQLYGCDQLVKRQTRPGRVWICEGEWDAIALRWLLNKAGRSSEVVVGVPGANVFKNKWVDWFRGWQVIICFDNDESGDNGAINVGKKLEDVADKIQYLCWPEFRPIGWDVRDYVVDGLGKTLTAKEGIGGLEALVKDQHRSVKPEVSESGETEENIADFSEVLRVFGTWVRMNDDFEHALAISLATCLANDVVGDPIWIYLIGPPASGKTVILTSLKYSKRTKFYSTLTPASLVSGFNTHPDPSIIPKLDGFTAVFKDGTELLAMHPDAKKEIYSTFRGAYDGYVFKPFGNAVVREYHSLHFNMLIGMTPAVYGDSQSDMGERFLQFAMHEDPDDVRNKIRQAIENISKELKMEEELGEVSRRFLLRKIDPDDLPVVQQDYVEKIISLSQVVAMLRAKVERDRGLDNDIKYRPFFETGTRIAKQMSKLGQMLCIIYNQTEISREVYSLLERVARDSCNGYHYDIVKTLWRAERSLGRDEIGKIADIPASTTLRRLQDLEQLKVVKRILPSEPSSNGHLSRHIRGPRPVTWILNPDFVKLWEAAFDFAEKTAKSVLRPPLAH